MDSEWEVQSHVLSSPWSLDSQRYAASVQMKENNTRISKKTVEVEKLSACSASSEVVDARGRTRNRGNVKEQRSRKRLRKSSQLSIANTVSDDCTATEATETDHSNPKSTTNPIAFLVSDLYIILFDIDDGWKFLFPTLKDGGKIFLFNGSFERDADWLDEKWNRVRDKIFQNYFDMSNLESAFNNKLKRRKSWIKILPDKKVVIQIIGLYSIEAETLQDNFKKSDEFKGLSWSQTWRFESDANLKKRCCDDYVYEILHSFTYPINEYLDILQKEHLDRDEFFEVFSKIRLVDEDRKAKEEQSIIEIDKRHTSWLMFKKRNNNSREIRFCPANQTAKFHGILKSSEPEANYLLNLMNIENDIHATEAIVDIGAAIPMVSRLALDKFNEDVQFNHPDLHGRILYTDANVRMSGANGQIIEAKKQVCTPIKLDLSSEWGKTAFVIAELGTKSVPFLLALPQLLKLDAVIDTTVNRECLISRRTGYAYRLRKPNSHLLFDLLNTPMVKLSDLPPRTSIGSNWTYPNCKRRRKSENVKKDFP